MVIFMNKKIIVSLIIIAIAISAFLAFSQYDKENGGNKETFNVSSEGPISLSDLVEDIKPHEYYKGYDNETVKWMESLVDKYVFVSSDEFVIMSTYDADKIPSVYACDVSFNEIFSAEVLEKHSLLSGKNSKDVYYVKNVEYIKEEAHYFEV